MGGFLSSLVDKEGMAGLKAGIKSWTQSGEYSLKKQGPVSGLLVKFLRTFESDSDREVAQTLTPMAEDAKYVAADPVRHAEYYRQKTTGQLASDPRTAKLASRMSYVEKMWYDKHESAGFKVAPRVQGPYHPIKYPKEMFNSKKPEYHQAIDYLTSRAGKTTAQAEAILESNNPDTYSNPLYAKFHPLETPRELDIPELARKDINVDFEHLRGAIRSYHEKTIFGEKAVKASYMLDMIKKEAGVSGYNYAKGVYSTFLGHNAKAYAGDTEKMLSSWETASHLGLAVMSHPAKTIESAFVGGLKPFLAGLNDIASDKDAWVKFAQDSGAVLNDTLHEVKRAAGVENGRIGSKVLRATGFMRVINFQEMLHANVGKHSVIQAFEDLVKDPKDQSAVFRLKSLGLDPDTLMKKGGPDEQDLLTGGYKMAKIVLGGRTVLDLPPLWRNNWAGRVLSMFKPFIFNQTKFIKDYVVKPAFKGDLRPLIYASIVYPTVGEAIADAKGFMRGKDISERPDADKYPLERVLDNVSQVGGFGVAHDILTALSSGQPVQLYKLLSGPMVGDPIDGIVAVTKSLADGDAKYINRYILGKLPIVGPAASNIITPVKHKKDLLQSGAITRKVEDLLQ